MVVVLVYNYPLASVVYYSQTIYCFMIRIGSCSVTCLLRLVSLKCLRFKQTGEF